MSTISENFNAFANKIKLWWQDFNLQSLSEKVGGSSAEAIQAAVYFGLSFISGYLFKKYAKFLLMLLVISSAILWVMQYNHVITIHWETLRILTGVEAPFEFGVLAHRLFEWIKLNILLTVAAALGFLVGYKLA